MMLIDVLLRIILVIISVGAARSHLSINTVMRFYQSLTCYYQVILPNYLAIIIHKKPKTIAEVRQSTP